MKIGRNETCPCGSGKKYKKCCGLDASAASETRHGLPRTHRNVHARAPSGRHDRSDLISLVNEGRWIEVENQARLILDSDPADGMAWKMLSVALVKQGREALTALERASDLLPFDVEVHANLGSILRDRGRWAEALASFQRAINLRPDHGAALAHAADSSTALGRTREAIGYYRRALEVSPAMLNAHNGLANAYYDLGEDEEAIKSYRAALNLKPDEAAIHTNLTNALRRSGRLDEAIGCAHRAIALQPRLATAHNNLGLALAASGRFQDAASSYRQALALDGGYVDALNNLGNVLRDLGERRECMALYGRAIEIDPNSAGSHCNMGNLLFESRRIHEAVASYARALSLDPRHGEANLSLGMALRMQGRPLEAEASCRAALRTDPNNAEALSLLGELLADRGRFSEAQELFQSAVAIKPDFPFVYLSIAMHRKMSLDDTAWLRRTESLVAREQPLRHQISLRYALGKYFDDTRQYDQAFGNYHEANELTKRNGLVYDAAALTRRVDQIVAGFDASSQRLGRTYGHPSRRPVFIVGMPRSGTSLTEQILASHPAVFGAGELPYWDAAFSAFEAAGSAAGDAGMRAAVEMIPAMALEYLEHLNGVAGDALRVVDKMPPNFMNLGLIHAAFPHAKIIHMHRHPFDTCLSIYFQYFLSTHPYANDLQNLAHYYGEYLTIMDHWRHYLPERNLLEVAYEALIDDQEGWTRRLIDFIELPWDPRCLDFHRTERVVITASKWQVRQKIHSGSAGRWKHYENYLGPLRPLIESADPDRRGNWPRQGPKDPA